jgi:hypothetical protein
MVYLENAASILPAFLRPSHNFYGGIRFNLKLTTLGIFYVKKL